MHKGVPKLKPSHSLGLLIPNLILSLYGEVSNLKGVEATPSTHVPLHIGHTITKYVVEEAGCVKSMGDYELEEKLQAM